MNDQMNKIINKVSAVTSAARNQTRQIQNESRAASSSHGTETQSFESPQSSSSRLQRIRNRTPTSNFTRLGNFSSNSTRVRYDPSNPTLQSTLSQMYSVAGNDKNKWSTLYNMFQRETQISTSPIYSPYLFNKPSTNTYYAKDNEERTQRFEAQWAQAKEMAAYWAGRTDLNLSDDDIIARVNLDGYSEIKALNEKISEGSTGHYTRSLGYSPDVLYGVIWAARNGGSTGNDLVDLMNYARGEGKGYERNEDIQARLDPSNERYNPYSVGSTADDIASYFGVAQFDSDWLAKNRYLLNGDDNDVKRYQQVYTAEQTTREAEAEYAELQKRMDSWFSTNVDDPNIILENLFGKDDVNGTEALSTLGKMDESLKSGKIMSMTRPVDYSYAEVVRQVQEHCDEVRAQKKTAAVADEISTYTGAGNTATAADTSIDTARDNALLASGRTIRAMGTGEEKLVFSTSRSGFERYMQQVRDAVSDGKGMSAEQVYDALLNGANQYAAQNYLAAREAFGNLSLDQMDEFSQKYGVAGLLTSDAQVSARAQLDSIRDSYILAAKLNDGKGADTSMLHLMDYLYDNGREYTPTEWSATTAFQMLIDSGSYTREQVAEGARETISQKQAKIDEIDGVLEQVQNAGIKGADKYVSNLKRMRDAYQQDVDDAKYFLIPEEAEDFKQVVSKYKFNAKEAWKGFDLFAGFKSEKNGIPQFDYQLVTLVNEKTGRRGIHDNSQDRYVNFLTDDEIDTYLYLSATQGYDKAQEYYNHLKEETLPVRAAIAVSENTADIASSGLLGAAAMSAMSVLASPAQVAGTAYSAIQGIRGEEINPYHGSFAANMFISSARGTVKNEISETLGEDTGWAKFANMTYDALMSSGDSLLSGAIGSGIAGSLGSIASKIPGGGKVAAYMAKKGANVASIQFMSAEAAGGAVMDAKMRGATDTQALLMGGISWVAESVTEFIPMDNIFKAFKGGSVEAARGLVSRVIRSAFEEAPGEMASEIIEGIADDLVMREMSERNLSVQEYIANGMDAEEAERKATVDFVKNVLYAGATGALSGVMSTGTAWLGGKLAGNNTQTETQGEALQDAEQRTADVQTVPEAQALQTGTQNTASSEIVANATDNINKGFESVYSQLAALSTAQQTQDKATQASVVSGVIESYGVDAETARAAGQMLVDRINGNRLIGAMEKMLYSSIEQGINASDAMKAVAYSGLADGYAGTNQILEISAQPTESISGDMLNNFIQSTLANAESTMQQMQKRVTDNAIANAMREIVADGGLDGIRTYETALQQAEQNVRTANEGLARVTAERDAAGQNLQDIQAKFVENPADPQMAGAMQQAIRDMEGKAKVVAEYQQSVAKFENQRQVAETTLNNARETAMKQVRQEAVQRVMEQRAALAEEAALRDAQVQQLAEEAVAANAQVQESVQTASPGIVQYSYGANGEQAQVTNSAPVVSPVETARTLAKDLGIGAALGTRKMDIAYRNSVPKEVRGYYEQRAKYMAVREGDASSYSVTMHEAGHAIADKTGLTGTQEMIRNLDPAFATNYDAQALPGEAFAEFTSLYMQDSARAEAFAGSDFMTQFEASLRSAGIDKAVHAARDKIQAYVNANTLARVRASWIDQADTIKKGSLAEREAEFVTNVFDWTRPFEDVDKAVNRQTGEYGNLRTIAKRRNFSDRVVSNLFTNALTDVDGNIIGDSFASAFSEIDARSADDFISYALMKHALDRDVQSKQVLANDITAEQMRRQIAQLEEASPEYKRALTKFENTWNQFMQAWMVDTGLLSQADFDAMRAMYPNYLPTQRYLGTESGYRRGRNTFTVRRATGSDLQVINPLDSIANYVNRIVDTVYKNNAALAWHEAYQTTEGLGEYAREITSDMRRESVNTENIQEKVRQILEESGTDSDIVADVLNTIGTEAVAWRDTGTSTEGNVLAVRLPNGESAYYQFTREGRLLYDALNGNGKATTAQRNLALRAFAKLTGTVSKMATTYAPTFAASNPIKDIQSSINYGSWAATYGDGIVKWLRGFREVWKESGEYKNYLAMGGGGWNSVNTGTRASTDDFRAKLFDNYWKRNTGNKLRNIENRAAHVGQKALEVVTLNRLNEIIENTSRYVEYRFGKNDTSTAEGRMKAFQAAQDVTTDFANGGKGNGVITARSLVPFLNPNLQGTYRAVRELSGRERGRLGARMGKRVLNTGMAVAVAAVLRNMFGKDDDKEHFANISDEVKATHLIIPNFFYKDSDRRFVRIPISQDPYDQLAHALFESAVEQYDGTDDFTTELLAAASAIVSNVTLGASDIFEEGDIEERLNGIMSGTVLGPLWGLVTNLNYYGGQIISDRLKELSAPLQYDDTTPELFKFIGRITGASPKALEYLVDQYGGYGGQLFVNSVSSAMDNNFNLLDVVKSVTGSFHKRFTIDSAYTNDISSAYSANRNFLTELKNNVSKTNTDGGLLRGSLTEDERKQAYEEAVAMTSKGGLIYETNKELSDLWTQVNEAKDNANLTDAERNRLILSCRDEIARKQMAVNDAMTDYCDKYVYTPNLFERIFKDIHEVTPYTTREKLSDIFQADSDKDYMQKATGVWEATGKDSALPHPNTSFSEQKTTYEISDEDWDGWETAYRDAYENYVARNASKWDGMTDEEKLGVLTKAHSEGHNAAKAWYWQTHEKPRQTDK